MANLREQMMQNYMEEHFPNAKIVDYTDKESKLTFYTAEQLQEVDEDWFPLCCYRDQETGNLLYGGRKRIVHTYTEGETGAGKTTRYVMQAVRALSSMKRKPSFLLVDIHGEIIENLYSHLRENGYDIKILNCDNADRSDCYNPLQEAVRTCIDAKQITLEAASSLRKIAEVAQPIDSTGDRIWDLGARSCFNGYLLDKVEDALAGDIPVECVNLYNVVSNHFWLRERITSSGGRNILNIPHYARKGRTALSVQKMIGVTNNAEKTRDSYYGVLENHLDSFGQEAVYKLSSISTIDIRSFIERPTVIVVQSGATPIGEDLIAFLVNDIYSAVVREGKKSKTKQLPRNLHCFLDEFANCNIAEGPEFIKMLTTSRKFGMYWHLILQCDAQLDRKFDENIAKIIRANCTELFMGAHDYGTKARFAESCGQKVIEDLDSRMTQQLPRFHTVNLLTPDKLDLMEEGCVYIKSNKEPLLRSYYEAFYQCKEFVPVDDIDSIYPYNDCDYKKTLFYPEDIPPAIGTTEYRVLKVIEKKELVPEKIYKRYVGDEFVEILDLLKSKHVINFSEESEAKLIITPIQMKLYQQRYERGLLKKESEKKYVPEYLLNRDKKEKSVPKTPMEEYELFRDLKQHIQKRIKEHGDQATASELKTFHLIPKSLSMAYVALIVGVKTPELYESERYIFQNPVLIKDEVLWTYVSNRDFKEKCEWEKEMETEYQKLQKSNMFPTSVLQYFEQAVEAMKKEWTLEELKNLKLTCIS